MNYLVGAIVAILAAVIGWLVATVSLRAKLAANESTIESLRGELAGRENELRLERDKSQDLNEARATLAAELKHVRESLAEDEKRLEELKTSFKVLSGEALENSSKQFLNLAGETFG